MIGRRGILGALGGLVAMTVPGAGGQQERPFNAPAGQATPPGVQAGVSGPTIRARLVIVSQSGTGQGVFIYAGTAAKGNPPQFSVSNSFTDPYGNTTQLGIVSYGSSGSYAQLLASQLLLFSGGSGFAALLVQSAPGITVLKSGGTAVGDTQALITLESANAAGGSPAIRLNAAAATLPVSSAGITTVPQLIAALVSAGVMS